MQVIRGAKLAPPRVFLYGWDKVGKSTFAAGSDRPLFIPTEDGVDELGPDRVPRVESYAAFKASLAFAAADDEHGAVVVDNLSGLETLIHAHVARVGGVASIEDFGYGKGYVKAEEVWANEVLPGLDRCRDSGKVVIVIGHAQIRRAEDPSTEPYDQNQPDLHKTASALFRKWSDVIAFAAKRVAIVETDAGFNKKVRRGTNVGDKRVLHLVDSPAFVAGNRYGLPASIDLSWDAFVAAMAGRKTKHPLQSLESNHEEEERASAEGDGNG